MTVRLILVDDHKLVRQGLVSLFDGLADIEVVGEAAGGAEGLTLLEQTQADVVLLDESLPDISGHQLIENMRKIAPRSKIIALTMHDDPLTIQRYRNAGVNGFMVKDCAYDELVKAVRAVADGSQYICEQVEAFLGKKKAHRECSPGLRSLSKRELHLLKFFVDGMSVKEVGERLKLSEKTVYYHRANLEKKLGARNFPQLVKIAIEFGICDLDLEDIF